MDRRAWQATVHGVAEKELLSESITTATPPTDAVPRRGKALGVVGPSLRVLGKQRDVSFHSENHFFLKRSI